MEVWELKDAYGLEHLTKGERPEPRPGPGQVLLEMRAASLNYRDLVVVRGGYGPRAKPPLIPVSDSVGVVTAIGEGVRRAAVDDRVAPLFFQEWFGGEPSPEKFYASLGGPLDGVLTRRMVVSEQGVARVPEHLRDEEAACLPCAGLTAWSAIVDQGRVQPGETVLVQGTGGVALFALQFAKMAGARVIVTSSQDDKLDRARALGADETINYIPTPDWDRVVKEQTGGRGVDRVVELGGAETLERSVRATRIGGRVDLIGVLSGASARLPLPLVVMRNVRLQGITVGSRDGFEAMSQAIAQHRMRPVVDRVFGFDEATGAFAHLDSHRHFGKVCVRH